MKRKILIVLAFLMLGFSAGALFPGRFASLQAAEPFPLEVVETLGPNIEVVYVDPKAHYEEEQPKGPRVHWVKTSYEVKRKKNAPPYPVKMQIQFDDPEAIEGFYAGVKGDGGVKGVTGLFAVGYEGEKQTPGNYKVQLDVKQPLVPNPFAAGKMDFTPAVALSYSIAF